MNHEDIFTLLGFDTCSPNESKPTPKPDRHNSSVMPAAKNTNRPLVKVPKESILRKSSKKKY